MEVAESRRVPSTLVTPPLLCALGNRNTVGGTGALYPLPCLPRVRVPITPG